MHVFGQKNAARRRATQEKAAQVANLQDAQEVIAQLMEQNAILTEQTEMLQQQLNDVQDVAAGLLEK